MRVFSGVLPFMAKKNYRKQQRYIEFREMRWCVPNAEWGDYVRRGFFERISERVARLRRGVDLVWEDGKHLLRDRACKVEVSIPSSWRLVERAALFDPNGPRLTPEEISREVRSQYGRTFNAWEPA
jgi:hypothetical protein